MMTRIMIASKTRPGIDLESLVAKHEFSVVSKSMFTTDGMPGGGGGYYTELHYFTLHFWLFLCMV